MTTASESAVIGYTTAFVWGVCLLISFVGWGSLVNLALFARDQTDWGQRAAWGLALSVCVGGLLNLTETISQPVIVMWVITGAVTWLIVYVPRARCLPKEWLAKIVRARRDGLVAVGSLLVCCLAVLQYSGWVAMPIQREGSAFVFPQETSAIVFNVHDDFHAYFVFPNKMLATGSMGYEPFSERRLNALGGQSFLHTFVLAALHEENLHLLEPGIATLILIGLLLGYFNERQTPVRIRVVVLLTLLLVPPPYMNISALVTGEVLFVSLFRTLAWDARGGGSHISRAAVIGLIAAAICALKSSLIPACVALFCLGYIFLLFASGFERALIFAAAAAAIFTGLFLLPWMVSMNNAFGTPLYPVLGTGPRLNTETSAGFLYSKDTPLIETLQILGGEVTSASVVALVVFAFALQQVPSTGRHRGWVFVFLLSSLLGVLAVAFLLIGIQTYRFHFPFVMAVFLISIADLLTPLAASQAAPHPYARSAIAAVLATGLFIGWVWEEAKFFYVGLAQNVHAAFMKPAASQDERESYRQMQLSIPEGQAVLTILEKPFLLDFRRNPIFIVDNPGGMPPSIPAFTSSEQLASYLLARSIRYIAYAYRNEAGIPRARFQGEYYDRIFDVWNLLDELRQTRTRIYDDRSIFVLDLLSNGGNIGATHPGRGQVTRTLPAHQSTSASVVGGLVPGILSRNNRAQISERIIDHIRHDQNLWAVWEDQTPGRFLRNASTRDGSKKPRARTSAGRKS